MDVDPKQTTVDDEDLNTTAPNPPNEWKMPEPIFRKTSGRLPQGYEKELENARAEHATSAAQDEVSPSEPVRLDASQADLPSKNSAVRLVLVALGVLAMIAFLVVFVALVYFFVLR